MAFNERRASVVGWIGGLTIAACAGIAALSGTVARAELTVKDLTGTAVPSIGPFYQDVNDAIQAFAASDYKAAFTRLQNARKTTPALAPAEVMMARLYFDSGAAPAGNAMLEAAIKTAPQDPEAYLLLAERALAEGRVAEAESMFPKVMTLVEPFNQNPRRKQDLQIRAYTVGALVDQTRGNLSAARSKLESLAKLDPKNAGAHHQLGRVLFAMNDHRGAYEEFKLMAQADEAALPADLMMASLYSDRATAQKWLDRAIQMNPDDARTRVSAVNYLLQTNQLEKANEQAEKAIALDPDGFDSNFAVGQLARMDGDFEKAAKHLSAAHLLQPANFDVMIQLALTLAELSDEDSRLRGLQFAELATRQNPENADYLAALGWINYRLDRKAAAERMYLAVVNARKGQSGYRLSSNMGYFLAVLQRDRGNIEEAVKVLRSSLDTDKPFAYRKPAEQLLAQLSKAAGNPSNSESSKIGRPPE